MHYIYFCFSFTKGGDPRSETTAEWWDPVRESQSESQSNTRFLYIAIMRVFTTAFLIVNEKVRKNIII